MREPSARRGGEPSAKRVQEPSAKRGEEPPFAAGKGLWLGALLVAALLHIGLAALAFWSPSATPQGQAQAAGTAGIEISLGPAGSAAGGPRNQAGEQVPEPVTEPAPEPELQTEAVPEPKPKPEPKVAPQPEPEPMPEPESQAQQAPKPVPTKPVPDNLTEPTPPRERTPPPTASVAGSAGKRGTTEQSHTGSGDNTAGGGLPGATRDYAATLLAWLEQHKQYPRLARMRRQQGTVMLHVVIDRQGKVLAHRIEKGTGYPALDNEVLQMIQRAQPLPAMPDTMDKEVLELVVPVQFFLQ